MITGMAPDVRRYLDMRSAFPTSLSADASKVLVLSDVTGTFQAYRVPRSGGQPSPVTQLEEPVDGCYLPTTDEILLWLDSGGNERHQLYLVADDGTGLRPLVRDPRFIHRPGGVTRDGSLLAYASNAGNGVDFDVHVLPLRGGGGAHRVFDQGGWCRPAGFSPDGRWLAVTRLTERNADNDVYLVDLSEGELVHASPHDDEASFGRPAWLGDSSGFFWSTDSGRDRRAIARFDLATRTSEYVLEPEWDASCATNWTGTRLLVTTNEDGYTRAELYDPTTLAHLGEVALPGAGVADLTFSPDGHHLVSSFTSPTSPGDAWAHDLDSGTLTRLTRSPGAIDAATMVEPELHRFSSFDGERLPVFVYLPRRSAWSPSSPVPVIVMVHGGPESQWRPSFNPLAQYFVARGYAVMAPNVRGSTGYGKRYHHLDDVERRLDAVADLAALHDWLAGDARFDAERAVLWGGSYGGYMVLAALAFQPERWAAGVDIVGISSLVTFLENTSVWRRASREREYGWLERDRAFLTEASPITHAERIRAPLFVVHGANDPRVPLSEAEQIHALLAAKGVRTELAVYADEGHGLARLANRLDAYPRAVEFIDEVLEPRSRA